MVPKVPPASPPAFAVLSGMTDGFSRPLLNCGISFPEFPSGILLVTLAALAAIGTCPAVIPDSPVPVVAVQPEVVRVPLGPLGQIGAVPAVSPVSTRFGTGTEPFPGPECANVQVDCGLVPAASTGDMVQMSGAETDPFQALL